MNDAQYVELIRAYMKKFGPYPPIFGMDIDRAKLAMRDALERGEPIPYEDKGENVLI